MKGNSVTLTPRAGRALGAEDRRIAAEMGHRIREARNRLGLTQQALAKQIGMTHATNVCAYERGQCVPKPGHLLALANALGMSINYLLGVDPKEARDTAVITGEFDPQVYDLYERFEGTDMRTCYEMPTNVGSLAGLPEVRRAVHKARQPEVGEEELAAIMAAEERRRERWRRQDWHAYVLISEDTLEALSLGIAMFGHIEKKLRKQQLEHLLEMSANYSLTFALRINPHAEIGGLRIYDGGVAVIPTVLTYVIIRDMGAVKGMVEEFNRAWTDAMDPRDIVTKYLAEVR